MTDNVDRLGQVLTEGHDAILGGCIRDQTREGLRRTDLVPAEESRSRSWASRRRTW